MFTEMSDNIALHDQCAHSRGTSCNQTTPIYILEVQHLNTAQPNNCKHLNT